MAPTLNLSGGWASTDTHHNFPFSSTHSPSLHASLPRLSFCSFALAPNPHPPSFNLSFTSYNITKKVLCWRKQREEKTTWQGWDVGDKGARCKTRQTAMMGNQKKFHIQAMCAHMKGRMGGRWPCRNQYYTARTGHLYWSHACTKLHACSAELCKGMWHHPYTAVGLCPHCATSVIANACKFKYIEYSNFDITQLYRFLEKKRNIKYASTCSHMSCSQWVSEATSLLLVSLNTFSLFGLIHRWVFNQGWGCL